MVLSLEEAHDISAKCGRVLLIMTTDMNASQTDLVGKQYDNSRVGAAKTDNAEASQCQHEKIYVGLYSVCEHCGCTMDD